VTGAHFGYASIECMQLRGVFSMSARCFLDVTMFALDFMDKCVVRTLPRHPCARGSMDECVRALQADRVCVCLLSCRLTP